MRADTPPATFASISLAATTFSQRRFFVSDAKVALTSDCSRKSFRFGPSIGLGNPGIWLQRVRRWPRKKQFRRRRCRPRRSGGYLQKGADLKTALQQIEKQFGEGSIMPLGGEGTLKIEGVQTGSLSLDIALGGKGVPRGRIIEIFGLNPAVKTTLALHICGQAQANGGIAAIIDAEHAFDPTWAKKIGVQLDTLLVSQPSTGEEAMQITEHLVKSNAVDVIVIDSVAALVPKAELEGEIGQSHVGLQARLMSQSMRKLTGVIAKSKTVVIFINQIREKVGVMFGSPETTPAVAL